MTKTDEVPRLSYTSIHTYEQCPLQYRYRYVDRLDFEPRAALSFGGSLHAALQWFYSGNTTHPPQLTSLLLELEEVWENAGYADADEERRHLEEARDILTNYYHKNVESFRLPPHLEEYFEVVLDDLVLTGRIDRVDRHPDGSYEIIDYKTNKRIPKPEWLVEDLQLPIYHYAVKQALGITPGRLTFYYLRHNQRSSTTRYVDERDWLPRMLERLRGVARSIRAGEFEPTPNHLCPWCDFTSLCPRAPGAERGLARLADKYADLARRRDNLQSLIRGLEAQLEEAWPGDEEAIHSKRNTVRRCVDGRSERFRLEP